ncbi:HNH endonuclease [Cryomorpha ignava]|uniref:HNH endonuclease n=1 Tax=Cryomorpha ignava TaxID=101383 RepID=A0A7K3WUL4_9FLAO|nr:HNH endonuclease [Cryomorpha ignava]NEN25357.1 HNH endonuclease [Cryomorpha ignava]
MTAKKKKSRYIPKKISQAVNQKHHFECAWCGVQLTERHHINEFSEGGEHSIENLILLCPICHTKTHNGKISKSELVLRKSTHFKSDRISANFKTSINQLRIKVGGIFYLNSPNFLTYKGEKVLCFEIKEGQLLINLKFFNKKGHLIFWMSENYYWYSSVFKISSGLDFVEILHNKEDFIFKIERIDDYLKIRIKTYLGGKIYDFNEEMTKLGDRFRIQARSISAPSVYVIS